MRNLSHARGRRRVDGKRQRGATLVEAAIITPVFFLMLFGIVEFGGAYRDKLALTNASTSGARVASAAADDAFSDFNILKSVASSLSAIPIQSTMRVVVFNAGGPDGVPTSSCKSGSSSSGSGADRAGACNVYTMASFTEDRTHFGCQAGYNLDRYYCPADRKVAITSANGGPPDYVGVWIRLDHAYWTKFIGSSVTLTDQTVIKIEPRRL